MAGAVTSQPTTLGGHTVPPTSVDPETAVPLPGTLNAAQQKVGGLKRVLGDQLANAAGIDPATLADLKYRADALAEKGVEFTVDAAQSKKAMHEVHTNMMVSKIMNMANKVRKFFSMLGYALANLFTLGGFFGIDYAVNNNKAVDERRTLPATNET